jgi:hypothetical protein
MEIIPPVEPVFQARFAIHHLPLSVRGSSAICGRRFVCEALPIFRSNNGIAQIDKDVEHPDIGS